MTPFEAWVLRRVVVGHTPNGEHEGVSEPFRLVAARLADRALEVRLTGLDDFLCGRPDAKDVRRAMAEADPDGPPPEAEPRSRPATLADLRKVMSEARWLWESYLPSAQLSGIAAFEGVGKTRLGLDLAFRIWFRLLWPDDQPATFPFRTPTLWVCADGQQDELAAAAQALGLPDEALYFNTFPDDPYGGTDLDDPEALARLEGFIREVRPGLVFIDTLTNATDRDFCRANEAKALMTPLRDIAQRTQTTIVPMLYLSKEGQPLGRRVKGLTRTILQIDCPDPEQPTRLKLSVSKSFAKKPPALGVTMTDAGNKYDFNPPTIPAPARAGRPAEARNKAATFIREALSRENDRIGNVLCAEWEKDGGNDKTFWRAVEDLGAAGDLTKDGGKGTGKQVVLHLNNTQAELETGSPIPNQDKTQNP